MRHDEHYVEALTSSAGSPIGRMVAIDQIDPNPNQPRQVMGDLSELMASIAEKGIIEPVIVRQRGPRFQIIAGERRYQAAIQVALVENLQRKDLTAFEEAEALYSLASKCDYTHEDMARRLGKSRTSITESLSINGMPEEVKNLCRLADIHSKSLLLQIVRQGDTQKMVALIEKITRDGGATREAVRKETAKPKPGRPKAYVFSYRAPTKAFKLSLKFNKSRVDRDEVITALENIIAELRSQ